MSTGQRRTNVGMTRERLELLDEVSAMLAVVHGGRAPGRPETIERICHIVRAQLRGALMQRERRKTTQ